MRALIALFVAGACLMAAPVMADDGRDPLARFEPGAVARGLVRENDVTLLFDFLRGSLAAAIQGREAPPPEELTARAEALGQALKAQGALAVLILLDALEQRAKQALREYPAPRPRAPSTQPFTPLQE
jgi:hypothetical protein